MKAPPCLVLTLLLLCSSLAGCTSPEPETEPLIDWGASERVTLTVNWTDTGEVTHVDEIVLDLCSRHAPMHAESFADHARRGNYDSAIFHRVINGFMIQGGDFENGDGTGGYAANFYDVGDPEDETTWKIPDEFDARLGHTEGVLSMAKTNRADSAGSQFFIVDEDADPSYLDGSYSIFGRTADQASLDVVNAISEVETGAGDRPVHDVVILGATVEPIEGEPVGRACQHLE